MADETTAVLELQTSTVEEEAPLTEETASDFTGQESDAETPETGESETFTREDLDKAIAEREEEIRATQRREMEEAAEKQAVAQYTQRLQQGQQYLTQQGHAQMQRVFDWMKGQIEEGKEVRWTPQVFQSIAGQVTDAAFNLQWQLAEEAFERKFGKNAIPPEIERRLRTAVAQGNGDAALDARYDALKHLVREEVREEIEREEAEKRKTDSVRTAAQTRQERTRPSTPKGDGAPAVRNPSDIIADPNSSLVEKRKAYRDAHGIDPPF